MIFQTGDALNVLVVGCGSIGKWHMKGLETSKYPIRVFAVDISESALKNLDHFVHSTLDRERFLEFEKLELNDLSKSNELTFDLTIVATTADKRFETCCFLKKCIQSNYWLIEKPLEQSSSRLKDLVHMFDKANVYVNHPRRMSKFYIEASTSNYSERITNLNIFGRDVGLACNISHFLDLACMLTAKAPIDVNISALDPKWHRSARHGFWDISGKISVIYDDDFRMDITCSQEYERTSMHLIKGDIQICTIDELDGKANFFDGSSKSVHIEPQSKITGRLLDELIETRDCNLPTLPVSAQYNYPVLDALLEHWQSSGNNLQRFVPFT